MTRRRLSHFFSSNSSYCVALNCISLLIALSNLSFLKNALNHSTFPLPVSSPLLFCFLCFFFLSPATQLFSGMITTTHCSETVYGCCKDNKTAAQGVEMAGCPSMSGNMLLPYVTVLSLAGSWIENILNRV